MTQDTSLGGSAIRQILSNGINPIQTPQTNLSSSAMNVVNGAIPGFNGLTSSATEIIRNLMSGNPSASPTRRANAYFGASSGMPGSDFVRNRGFDLYNEKGDQNQQRGFQDLLSLLSGYSGTVFPTVGQQQQGQQWSAEFANKQQQQAIENALQAAQLEQQNKLARQKSGEGVLWNSSPSGATYDKFGTSLGYNPDYDSDSKFRAYSWR